MNKLINDKYRPTKIEDFILLDRIYDKVKNGLNNKNVILYGNYGTGKTSLARVLIGKYSKKTPYLELNSSYYTSIDTLRTIVDDFCSKVQINFETQDDYSDTMKYVYLDEVDRTSAAYQDALKAYIEEYSERNVRFIMCTNHIDKVSPGMISRFLKLNFNPETKEEEIELKKKIFLKIKNDLFNNENKKNIEFRKEDIGKIINKSFPDIRNIYINIEDYLETGNSNNTSNRNNNIDTKIINLILDKTKTFNDIYHFTYENFGNEGIKELISIIIKKLVPHLISINTESKRMFEIIYITSDYETKIENSIDPIIVGVSLIGKIKDILEND